MQRTLLITGASSGIGLAICAKMLTLGHRVLGVSRRRPKLECAPAQFQWIQLDLTDTQSISSACKTIISQHPDVSAFISAAGKGEFTSLEEFSHEQIQQYLQLNLLSHLYLTRALLPHFKQLGHADIIFIGSDAALKGSKKGSLYCACKFALRGFAQSLRAECAGRGVRVASIQPGMTDTAFYADLNFKPGDQPTQHLLPEDIAEAVALVIQARPGTVYDEIQLSPLSKFIQFKKNV